MGRTMFLCLLGIGKKSHFVDFSSISKRNKSSFFGEFLFLNVDIILYYSILHYISFVSTATKDQFLDFLKSLYYRSPWLVIQILPARKIFDGFRIQGLSSIPTRPTIPLEWIDVDANGRNSALIDDQYFKFPLFGEAL